MSATCIVAALWTATVGLQHNAPAEVPAVAELERRVLMRREQIRSAVLDLDSVVQFYEAGMPTQKRQHAMTVFIDGDRRRIDRRSDPLDVHPDSVAQLDPDSDGRRITALADGVARVFSTEVFEGGARLLTTVVPADSPQGRLYRQRLPDPRLIGIYPETFANLRHCEQLNCLIGSRADTTDVSIAADTFRGMDCLVLTYLRTHSTAKVWVLPDRDDSVVRIVVEEGTRRDELICDLARVEDYGWFPSRVTFRETDGDLVRKTQDLTVSVRQFNEPLDPSTFDFTGMGVPPGERIYSVTPEGARYLIMTESGPVEQREAQRRNQRASTDRGVSRLDRSSRSRTWKWLLGANAGLFAVLAIWLIWRSGSRRNGSG